MNSWPFSLGVENISDTFLRSLRSHGTVPYRVGLITNQTGCDQQGNRTVDILCQKGVRISYLLAPEHGLDGKAPAGKPITDSVDQKTGIPIVSVYGQGGDYSIKGKRFDPRIVKQLDVLCYDIQDVGMRHYTYISTLLLALEAAAEHDKPIAVFDRPNLLGPNMEGPLVDPDPKLQSFISIVPIPLRHGMTVGELALYFNTHILKKKAKLHVVRMKNYKRTSKSEFFMPLSPNLKALQSCYGYSFLGLLGEVGPFDLGIGTPYAFQSILLPDSLNFSAYEWSKFRALLQKYGIQTMHHSLTKRRRTYSGFRLQFPDIMRVSSFRLLLDVLQFFKDAGITLSFSNSFDKAMGTPWVRELYTQKRVRNTLTQHVAKGLDQFIRKAQGSLLYEPFPKIVLPD